MNRNRFCSFLLLLVVARGQAVKREPYKPKGSDFVVVCTLFNGPAPGATEKTPALPITYDPRFAIGARIDRIVLGKVPWRKGEIVTFVIHSPTQTLGHEFAGQQFTLTFSHFRPTSKDDKIWFEPETRYLLRWIEPAKRAGSSSAAPAHPPPPSKY